MSLTSTLFDKNAYNAELLSNIDTFNYMVNKNYPSYPSCNPDHLNGFHGKHANPFVVDTESDLLRLDDILSNDPYYMYPNVNNGNSHTQRKTCTNIPSEQYTRLYYYYPLSELSYSRYDPLAVFLHPIHSNNYIGANTKEQGRFTSVYVPGH
jgi:hypothetical protein